MLLGKENNTGTANGATEGVEPASQVAKVVDVQLALKFSLRAFRIGHIVGLQMPLGGDVGGIYDPREAPLEPVVAVLV